MIEMEKEARIGAAVRVGEQAMWKAWSTSRDPSLLGKLMDSFAPIIGITVAKFREVPIPDSAIEAEAKRQALKAFQTYDPTKGAALGTHVTNRMKKVNDFIYEHQNIGRIPKHRITQIGTFNAVKVELGNKHGRSPSAVELADELGWSLPEIERMELELRGEVPETALETDFSFTSVDPAQKVLQFIYYELSPREKVVFEHVTGWAGKAKASDAEIAGKLGISQSRVRAIRSDISKKIQRRLP